MQFLWKIFCKKYSKYSKEQHERCMICNVRRFMDTKCSINNASIKDFYWFITTILMLFILGLLSNNGVNVMMMISAVLHQIWSKNLMIYRTFTNDSLYLYSRCLILRINETFKSVPLKWTQTIFTLKNNSYPLKQIFFLSFVVLECKKNVMSDS